MPPTHNGGGLTGSSYLPPRGPAANSSTSTSTSSYKSPTASTIQGMKRKPQPYPSATPPLIGSYHPSPNKLSLEERITDPKRPAYRQSRAGPFAEEDSDDDFSRPNFPMADKSLKRKRVTTAASPNRLPLPTSQDRERSEGEVSEAGECARRNCQSFKQVKELDDTLTTFMKKGEDSIKNVEETMANGSQRIKNVEQTMGTASKRIKSVEEAVKTAKEDIKGVEQAMAKRTKAVEDLLSQRMKNVEETVAEDRNQIDGCKIGLESCRNGLKTCKTDIVEVKLKVERLENETHSLRQNAKVFEGRLAKQEEDLERDREAWTAMRSTYDQFSHWTNSEIEKSRTENTRNLSSMGKEILEVKSVANHAIKMQDELRDTSDQKIREYIALAMSHISQEPAPSMPANLERSVTFAQQTIQKEKLEAMTSIKNAADAAKLQLQHIKFEVQQELSAQRKELTASITAAVVKQLKASFPGLDSSSASKLSDKPSPESSNQNLSSNDVWELRYRRLEAQIAHAKGLIPSPRTASMSADGDAQVFGYQVRPSQTVNQAQQHSSGINTSPAMATATSAPPMQQVRTHAQLHAPQQQQQLQQRMAQQQYANQDAVAQIQTAAQMATTQQQQHQQQLMAMQQQALAQRGHLSRAQQNPMNPLITRQYTLQQPQPGMQSPNNVPGITPVRSPNNPNGNNMAMQQQRMGMMPGPSTAVSSNGQVTQGMTAAGQQVQGLGRRVSGSSPGAREVVDLR